MYLNFINYIYFEPNNQYRLHTNKQEGKRLLSFKTFISIIITKIFYDGIKFFRGFQDSSWNYFLEDLCVFSIVQNYRITKKVEKFFVFKTLMPFIPYIFLQFKKLICPWKQEGETRFRNIWILWITPPPLQVKEGGRGGQGGSKVVPII